MCTEILLNSIVEQINKFIRAYYTQEKRLKKSFKSIYKVFRENTFSVITSCRSWIWIAAAFIVGHWETPFWICTFRPKVLDHGMDR